MHRRAANKLQGLSWRCGGGGGGSGRMGVGGWGGGRNLALLAGDASRRSYIF